MEGIGFRREIFCVWRLWSLARQNFRFTHFGPKQTKHVLWTRLDSLRMAGTMTVCYVYAIRKSARGPVCLRKSQAQGVGPFRHGLLMVLRIFKKYDPLKWIEEIFLLFLIQYIGEDNVLEQRHGTTKAIN